MKPTWGQVKVEVARHSMDRDGVDEEGTVGELRWAWGCESAASAALPVTAGRQRTTPEVEPGGMQPVLRMIIAGALSRVMPKLAARVWIIGLLTFVLGGWAELVRANETAGNGSGAGLPIYDPSFELEPTVWISRVQQPGRVLALAEQEDGRILVAGSFDHLGFARTGLVRLDPRGRVEMEYAPQLRTADGGTVTVRSIALGGQDSLFIAGNFVEVGGVPRHGVARLLPDGALDRTFDPGVGAGWSDPARGVGTVRWIAVGNDGAVYIGGSFDTFGGVPRAGIARLRASGEVDPGFVPELEPGSLFNSGVILPDGRLLVGGGPNRTTGSELVRLDSAGALDRVFARRAVIQGSLGAGPAVRALAVDSGGRVYVGGDFTSVGGAERRRLARLLGDGTVDSDFLAVGIPAGTLDAGAVTWVGVDRQDRPWVAGSSGDARDTANYYFGGLELSGAKGGSAEWIVREVKNGVSGIEGGWLLRDGRALVRGYVSRAEGDGRPPGVARVYGPFAGAVVAWEAVSPHMAETAGVATVRLRRIGRLDEPVSVRVATRDLQARGGEDYAVLDAEVSFAPGEDLKEVSVRALADALHEGAEWFRVEASPATADGIPVVTVPGSIEVRIDDDDSGFEFDSAETIEVKEGTREVGLVVRRVTDLPVAGFVNFRTLAGSARAGQDYEGVDGGVLSFAAGEFSKVLTIRLVDDAEAEPREEFGVELFEPLAGSSIGGTNTRRVRLVDNESAFVFAPVFAGSGILPWVMENQGSHTETVMRLGDLSRSASVRVVARSGESTMVGQDFLALDQTIEFPIGVSSRPVVFRVLNNPRLDLVESRTVVLVLKDPSESAMLGAEFEREVAIYDDETGFRIDDAILNASAVVQESSRIRSLTVRRGFDAPTTVSVGIEAIGEGAQVGADFVLVTTNRLMFEPGQMTGTVEVAILEDAVAELDETFRVRLVDPDPGTRLDSPAEYRLVIRDNEPGFSIRAPTHAAEGQSRVMVEVVRSQGTGREASVRVATGDLTAQAGADYVAINTVLHFAAGELVRTVAIELLDDVEAEHGEQFTVGLFDPSAGAGLVPPYSVLVAIDDDEPVLSLIGPQRVKESQMDAAVTIHRQGVADREVRVDLVAADSSAFAGLDFTGFPLSVVLAVGETNRTIPIPLVNDAQPEYREYFQLRLENPGVGATLAGASSTLWIQIEDDDAPEDVVGFESARYEVGEFDRFVRVWLTRSAAWGTGQVKVHVEPLTAQVGADFTGGSVHIVTLWAGTSRVAFEIPVVEDGVVEGDEEFRLRLSVDPQAPEPYREANLRIGALDTALVRVRDQAQSFEFVETELRVPENGAPGTLTVRRRGDASAPASVRYRLVAGSASSSIDFENQAGLIEFPAGRVLATIPVRVTDDFQAEGLETFEAVLESPSPDSMVGPRASCAVMIEDDERLLSEDPTFDAQWIDLGSISVGISGLDVTPDGRTLVSASRYLPPGPASSLLARILPDGRFDRELGAELALADGLSGLGIVRVLPDGRTLVVVNGLRAGTPFQRARVVRLNPDGRIDPGFSSAVEFAAEATSAWVEALVLQADGRILVGGAFTEAGGLPRRAIARLLPDGGIDADFDPGMGPAVHENAAAMGMNMLPSVRVVALAGDGRIYVGGSFGFFAGQPRPGLARLYADGRLDPDFVPDSIEADPVPTPYGSTLVAGVQVQSDGKVVVAGIGATMGAVRRPGMVRLDPTGRLDPTFDAGLPEGAVGLQVVLVTGGRLWAVWQQPVMMVSGLRMGLLEGDGARLATYFDAEPANGIGPIAALPDGRLMAAVARYTPQGGGGMTLARFDPVSRDLRTVGLGAERYGVAEKGGILTFDLVRGGNSEQSVEVAWSLRAGTAAEGADFAQRRGRVALAPGQNRLQITLDALLDDGQTEGLEEFQIVIEEATGGVLLWPRAVAVTEIADDEISAALDLRFLPGFDGRVDEVFPLEDSGLIVSGEFVRSAEKLPGGLSRAFSDGTVDMAFDPGLGMGAEWDCCVHIRAVAADVNGGLVVLGHFFQVQGQDHAGVVKITPDGAVDSRFRSPPSADWSWVRRVALQPDGRVVLAGWSPRLERLLADGRPDPSLQRTFASGSIERLWPQADGQLLVAGWFMDGDGQTRGPVVRLREDGSLDERFAAPAGIGALDFGFREAVAALSDGSVILTASGAEPAATLFKLRPDGLLDAGFRAPLTSPGLASAGLAVLGDSDGSLWVAGVGAARLGDTDTVWLTRRLPSGAPDTGFPPVPLTIARDGTLDPSRVVQLASAGAGAVYVYPVDRVGGVRVGPVARVSSRAAVVPTIGFAAASAIVAENAGHLELEIIRQGDDFGAVEAHLEFAPGGTALPGRDFDGSPVSVRFAAKETRRTVRIPIFDNPDVAPDRTIRISISGTSPGAVVGRSSMVVSVLDDDARGAVDLTFDSGLRMGGNYLWPLDVQGVELAAGGTMEVWGNLQYVGRARAGGYVRLTADGEAVESNNYYYTRSWPHYPTEADPGPPGRRYVVREGVLVRLLEGGSVDPSFKVPIDGGSVAALAQTPDGRLLIGGSFSSVAGVPMSGLARLLPDGRVDASFQLGRGLVGNSGNRPDVVRLHVQSDGSVLLTGSIGMVDGVGVSGLVRLLPSGAPDTRYLQGLGNRLANSSITAMTAAADGSVFLAGWLPGFGRGSGPQLVELNPDGTLDRVLSIGSGPYVTYPSSAYSGVGSIHSMAIAVDGSLWVGGAFTEFAGLPRHGLVRLRTDAPVVHTTVLTPLRDGQVRLRVTAPADVRLRVESSVDLKEWSTEEVFTSLGPWTDLVRSIQAGNQTSRRYYRVRLDR